jgi:urease accessory protein UreF
MLFDTQTLTRVIERSNELSENANFSDEAREELSRQGKRLREQLLHLLSARFNPESAEFKQAISSLHETHHAVTQACEDIQGISLALQRLPGLVDALDAALKRGRQPPA